MNKPSFANSNSFDHNAGAEELQHLQALLNELTEGQLKKLAENCGNDLESDKREDYFQVLKKADREDFYREYREIVKNNVCLMTEA